MDSNNSDIKTVKYLMHNCYWTYVVGNESFFSDPIDHEKLRKSLEADNNRKMKKAPVNQPTSCTNEKYANDMSFSSRYAYDHDFMREETPDSPEENVLDNSESHLSQNDETSFNATTPNQDDAPAPPYMPRKCRFVAPRFMKLYQQQCLAKKQNALKNANSGVQPNQQVLKKSTNQFSRDQNPSQQEKQQKKNQKRTKKFKKITPQSQMSTIEEEERLNINPSSTPSTSNSEQVNTTRKRSKRVKYTKPITIPIVYKNPNDKSHINFSSLSTNLPEPEVTKYMKNPVTWHQRKMGQPDSAHRNQSASNIATTPNQDDTPALPCIPRKCRFVAPRFMKIFQQQCVSKKQNALKNANSGVQPNQQVLKKSTNQFSRNKNPSQQEKQQKKNQKRTPLTRQSQMSTIEEEERLNINPSSTPSTSNSEQVNKTRKRSKRVKYTKPISIPIIYKYPDDKSHINFASSSAKVPEPEVPRYKNPVTWYQRKMGQPDSAHRNQPAEVHQATYIGARPKPKKPNATLHSK